MGYNLMHTSRRPLFSPFENRWAEPGQQKPLIAGDLKGRQRIHRTIKRTKAIDIVKAIFNSRIFSAFIIPGLALLATVGICALVGVTPPGWVLLAIAAIGFVIGFFFPLREKRGDESTFTLIQSLEFELYSMKKLNTPHIKKFQEIVFFDKTDPGTLLMGTLPNRNDDFAEYLANVKHVGAVLSADPSWQKRPVGVSLPLRTTDWNDLGMNYCELDVDDRHLLDRPQCVPGRFNPTLIEMERGADFIKKHLCAKENVYVSGEAGRQAIAAYLVKYCDKTSEQAFEIVPRLSPPAKALIHTYYSEWTEQRIYPEEALLGPHEPYSEDIGSFLQIL